MGYAADIATIQSRTLNLGKGAAVHSKRVQADRVAYHVRMKHTLEQTANLRVVQAEITDIIEEIDENSGKSKGVRAVITRLGERWDCNAVIIATGTYPEAKVFVGDKNFESGPDGSLPSKGLSASLSAMGIRLMRFKTGTPARVKRETIDLSVLEVQPGENDAIPFSTQTDKSTYLQGE